MTNLYGCTDINFILQILAIKDRQYYGKWILADHSDPYELGEKGKRIYFPFEEIICHGRFLEMIRCLPGNDLVRLFSLRNSCPTCLPVNAKGVMAGSGNLTCVGARVIDLLNVVMSVSFARLRVSKCNKYWFSTKSDIQGLLVMACGNVLI